jgi:TRAP-type C4-dicarboxylate transport system substrate-binding protein
MRERGKFITVVCLISISILLGMSLKTACNASPASEKTINLRLAGFVPPTHVINLTAKAWAEEISKRTRNRVNITIHPSETLLSAENMYEGVLSGAADIGYSCFSYNKGLFPTMLVLDQPLFIPSATAGTKVGNALYKKYKPKELSKIKMLYIFTCSPSAISSNKPIQSISDLKGQTIRCSGGEAPIIRAFGAVPVTMPMSEALMAIQKGVVDGCTPSLDVLKPMKIAEVQKFLFLADFSVTGFWMGMNLSKWNSLPSDIRKVIDQVNEEWVERAGSDWDKAANEGLQYAKDLGIKIVPMSSSDKARGNELMKPLVEKYVEEITAKGLPGKQILNDMTQLIEKHK